MAGGIGSRFWPMSTQKFPKQFQDILGTGRTMIQQTFDRIKQIVALAYDRLCGKITGQRIKVANEASLQLQLASILKTLGELYEESPSERFNIELEKSVKLTSMTFAKSGTEKANIDVWFSIEDIESGESHSCAIELKYFKRANHREPNNRYDVFKDLQNLERYGDFVDVGYLLVATDHPHYINQEAYSPDTGDFDFRHGGLLSDFG